VKHLLSIRDLGATDLERILALSEQAPQRLLQDKGVALYFEKPSARTRNSMEMARGSQEALRSACLDRSTSWPALR
jgi:ornithine carbamoyltransferase